MVSAQADVVRVGARPERSYHRCWSSLGKLSLRVAEEREFHSEPICAPSDARTPLGTCAVAFAVSAVDRGSGGESLCPNT